MSQVYPILAKSNGSYGRWVVYFSENNTRWFWHKNDALKAIDEFGEEPFRNGPDTNF